MNCESAGKPVWRLGALSCWNRSHCLQNS